jgi:elongation factor P
MINVTDLRAGKTFQMDGAPYQVILYEHQKLGRGTATIKVKAKNFRTGTVKEISFISGARVEEAPISSREAQYLYKCQMSNVIPRRARDDAEQSRSIKCQMFTFMDPKTFEQFELKGEQIGSAESFLKEGMAVQISFYEGEPLAIELPIKMEFKIKETGPGVRGDSATNIWKPAVLDNGLKIKVPLFIGFSP